MTQCKNKHKKSNTKKARKLLHKIFKTLKTIFEALEVLKTIIDLFR